jgi:hypothetical protein
MGRGGEMSEEALIGVLEKIRAIIDEALTRETRPARKAKRRKGGDHDSKVSSTLPNYILGLRDSGFFKQPKTVVEVHEKLQSSYHCEVNRVSMALLRLHKKRALRKTSKTVGKRKQVAYVW